MHRKAKFHESVMETMLALLLHPQVHLYLFSVGNNFSFNFSCLVKSTTPVCFYLNAGSQREQWLISKNFLPLKYATVPLSTNTHNSWFNRNCSTVSQCTFFLKINLLHASYLVLPLFCFVLPKSFGFSQFLSCREIWKWKMTFIYCPRTISSPEITSPWFRFRPFQVHAVQF